MNDENRKHIGGKDRRKDRRKDVIGWIMLMDFGEMKWDNVDCIVLAQDRHCEELLSTW
jgi:hypothetical protein